MRRNEVRIFAYMTTFTNIVTVRNVEFMLKHFEVIYL
jgi:hypothetical protein